MTSATLARRLSGLVERRFDRRGFFARSAMAGTALAVAPTDFVLKPGTAYAAICSCQGQACTCGSMCCDGYTEFCCTITGRNTCPPGTILGGWWKADGAGFCDGPRYYMDCNAGCGSCGCGANGICSGSCSGTTCGCANGSCDNRKAGCVQFRYGQCNQQVACLGPIVCRLVSCIPPWEINGTCTTTVRVDEYTRYHDRPCLHGVQGVLETAGEAPGGARVTGWAIDADTSLPVDVEVLVDGVVAARGRADRPRADVALAFPGHGSAHGFDVTAPMGPGTHQVCVRVLNRGPDAGATTSLGCRSVTSSSPFGNLELVRATEPGKVRIAGWALDPDTTGSIEVHVYVNGVGRANVLASIPRADVAAAFGRGDRHGFDVTLDVGTGRHDVCVYAINVGNGGNVALGCRTVELGRPFGTVDLVRAQPGAVRVAGWALDPDTLAPCDVHIWIGALGTSVPADDPRPDVGAALGMGSNRGFDTTIPLPAGEHVVKTFAINRAGYGGNSLIDERQVTVGGHPVGVIDLVRAQPGGIRVSGWALDPDSSAPIEVHVYVDGIGAANVKADHSRPDVAKAFPGWGEPHGFDVTVPAGPGAHQVCAYAINVGAGGTTLLGCRSVVLGGSPVGNLELVRWDPATGLRLVGWALDPDTDAPVAVHVYVDGIGRSNTPADLARPDIPKAFPGWGPAHGFDLTLPMSLDPGQHEVCVYLINEGAGGTTGLPCKPFTVA